MARSKKIEEERKEKNLYNIAEFAGLTKVSSKTVEQWKRDGILSIKNLGGYDYIQVANSLLNLFRLYFEKANNKENTKNTEILKNELLQANIKYKNTQTELQEMRRDIQNGRYLLTEKVKEELKEYLEILRNLYLSIPSMMMTEIENKIKKDEIREIQHKLENKINKIFKNYVDNGKVIGEVEEKSKIEINEAGEIRKKRGRKKS